MWAEIIRAAATSGLGLLALVILVSSSIVLSLFSRRDHWGVRISVVAILGAFALFSYAVSRETSNEIAGKPVATDECGTINSAEITPLSGPGGAYWCRFYATLPNLRAQQGAGYCQTYVASFGDMSQRALVDNAITDAKAGRKREAVEKIKACQCHNPQHHDRVQAGADQTYCWLRKQ